MSIQKDILYLCHGRNHGKFTDNEDQIITIDKNPSHNPDLVINLKKDIRTFNETIEDNTIIKIKFMNAPYLMFLQNDKLINICYNKLKKGGVIEINK